VSDLLSRQCLEYNMLQRGEIPSFTWKKKKKENKHPKAYFMVPLVYSEDRILMAESPLKEATSY
jgi:hypothetical protein